MTTTPQTPDRPTGPTLASTLAPEHDAALRALLKDQVTMDVSTRRPVATRRLLILGAAAAAVASMSAVLVSTNPGEPRTYAAWTAIPVTAPGADVPSDTMEQWATACSDLGVGGIAVEGVPANAEGAAKREVLVDRRGSYTYCLDISPGTATPGDPLMAVSGLVAEAGREKGLSHTWGTTFDRPYRRPAAGGVLVLGGDVRASTEAVEDPDVISLRAFQLYGMAGNDVDSVDIVLANGLRITATVKNGRWGAWWPTDQGSPEGMRLQVRSGGETQVIDPREAELPWDDTSQP